MAKERILIVEDEAIVAADLETTLQKLGFTVVATAATGEKAVENAETTKPDLVLMDIRLKGEMDGIDAAEQITAQFNIPVIYLTAYADETTLERAKTTMPFGYILKPFQENDIRAAVEVALYKHQMEGMLSSIQNWHASALQNIPEAVVATDKQGDLTFMNERAESLLGWILRDLCGKPISKVFTFPVTPEHMLAQASPSRTEMAASLLAKDGRTLRIQYSTAFTKNMQGETTGLLIVFHPAINGSDTAESHPVNPAGKK
jgi:PAS domain S-box-containing protein